MLFQEKPTNFWSTLKSALVNLMTDLICNSYDSFMRTTAISIVQTVVIVVLQFSIIFRGDLPILWKDPLISYLTEFFQRMSIERLMENNQVFIAVQATLLSIQIVTLFMFGLYCAKIVTNKSFLTLLVNVIRYLGLLSIPIFEIIFLNFTRDSPDLITITRPLSAIISTLYLSLLVIFTFLYLNPLPKNNPCPRISTDFQLVTLFFCILKTFIVVIKGVTLLFLLLSIVCDVFKLYIMEDLANRQQKYLARLRPLLTFVTAAVAIFAGILGESGRELFVIWVVSVGMVVLVTGFRMGVGNQEVGGFPSDCLTITAEELTEYLYDIQTWELKAKKTEHPINYLIANLLSHINSCRSFKCYLKENEDSIIQQINTAENEAAKIQTAKDSQKAYVSKLLRQKALFSETATVLLHLYLYQQGSLVQLRKMLKRPTGRMSFEITKSILTKMMECDDVEDYGGSQDRFIDAKKNVSEQLRCLVRTLKLLVSQLRQKMLRITTIQMYGYECYLKIQEVKRLFAKLLKYEKKDLKLCQFYIQLFKNVLGHQQYVEDVTKNLKQKNQSDNNQDQLNLSPIPSLQINIRQNGIITDLNSQAIKLMKCQKQELNGKTFQSLLLPNSPSHLQIKEQFNRLMKEQKLCLLKVKSESGLNIIPIKIKSRIKELQDKKQYIVEMTPAKDWGDMLVFLGPKDEVLCTYPEKFSIYYEDIMTQTLYQQYIKPRLSELKLQKKINLQLSNPNLMHLTVNISNCLWQNHQSICIRAQKSFDLTLQSRQSLNEPAQSRRAIIFQSFLFTYIFEQKIILLGEIQDGIQQMKISKQNLVDRKQTIVVLRQKIDQGIKSYRLYGDIIINIELQNQEAFVQTYGQNPQQRFKLELSSAKISTFLRVLYLVLIILFIGMLFLVGMGLTMKLQTLEQKQLIFKQLIRVQTFQIYFYRMLCVLRDARIQPNINWKSSLSSLFDKVQKNQNVLMFSKNYIEFSFKNKTRNAFLDELCNVILDEIFSIGQTGNLSTVPEIQQLGSTLINKKIDDQKDRIVKHLFALSDKEQINSYVSLVIVGCFLIIFMPVLWLTFKLQIQKRQHKMMPYRMLSDDQLRSLSQRLDRFQILYELSQKNDDVDIFNEMEEMASHHKRQTPKHFLFERSLSNKAFIIAIIFVVSNLVIFGYSAALSTVSKFKQKESIEFQLAIQNIYSNLLCYSAGSHNVSESTVEFLMQTLTTVQQYKDQNLFSQEFDKIVDDIFFNSTCNGMEKVIPNIQCTPFLGNISNPFLFGLDFYFNNLIFNIRDDFEGLYAPTGFLGQSFSSVFVFLAKAAQHQMTIRIQAFKESKEGYVVAKLFGALMLLLIIVGIWVNQQNHLERDQLIHTIFDFHDEIKIEKQIKPEVEHNIYNSVSSNEPEDEIKI